MRDEFAVSDGQNVLYKTGGFQPEQVTDSVDLSGGMRLLICSQDKEALRLRLQEAEEAISAKDTFLSSMSHDIRTPMNAIVGLTLLAKMHLDETARVSDALNKIETASGHLLSLINDVLDMSHINSGRMQINAEPFSLNDLIHDTLVIVRPQAEKKKHRLRFATEGIAAETLTGDILRLRQIFVNIISNAVKYTPDQGEISVRFSEELRGGRCELIFTCEDNGIGMSEEFLERIFEPFERVRSSTVSRIEGTGLGMSIVKKLTEAMGGSITVHSRLQQGTSVLIRIPLDYSSEQPDREGLEDKRILVLEATPSLQQSYGAYLGDAGIAHTVVASVQQAMSALADADIAGQPYHAVIIGQACGADEDRLDFAAYLHKAAPELPLLLISDENWEEISYRAEHSGIVSFVALPLLRSSLLNGLKAALRRMPGAEPVSAYPDLRGRSILLVEDNFINSEIAREILGMTGAEVDLAENGREAVDRYTAAPDGCYSLILMDVQMPVMNGYEAAELIRGSSRPDAASIPIYAMTANTFAEDIARAHAAGMNGHIAKPIDVNALMQVLRAVTGR